MKLHLKTLVLAAFFAFAVFGLQAQEKYEYLILEANDASSVIYISTDGRDFKKVIPNREEYIKLEFPNMIIKEIHKIEDDGWELFTSQIFPIGTNSINVKYYYQFRKKR